MPSPQSLVTFAATLFLTLLVTRVRLDLVAISSAMISVGVALVLAGIVAIKTAGDDDEDDVTEEAKNSVSSDEPPHY